MKLIMRHDPFFSLDPLAGVSSLRRDVSRLFDFAFPAFGRGFSFGNVDLYRAGEKFVLRAELPGVAKDKISVDVVDGKLILSLNTATSVEKPVAATAETVQVSTDGSVPAPAEGVTTPEPVEKAESESESAASYSRSFKLPAEVDAEKISARYENGVLTVEIPQREEVKPLAINIQVD